MKAIFNWNLNNGIFTPSCSFHGDNDTFNSTVSSFLTDDEGLGLDYLQKWVVDGVEKIDSLKSNEQRHFDWWGQAWGAEIAGNEVTIYWGYDDTDCSIKMSFSNFYQLITSWKNFILSKPDLYGFIEISI